MLIKIILSAFHSYIAILNAVIILRGGRKSISTFTVIIRFCETADHFIPSDVHQILQSPLDSSFSTCICFTLTRNTIPLIRLSTGCADSFSPEGHYFYRQLTLLQLNSELRKVCNAQCLMHTKDIETRCNKILQFR